MPFQFDFIRRIKSDGGNLRKATHPLQHDINLQTKQQNGFKSFGIDRQY